jgi:hypothetical protein
MNVSERKIQVDKLIRAFVAGSLIRNAEYQRGEAWTEKQKAGFIDSVFRGYPVPALFLHARDTMGLDEQPTRKHEIIDGQQRLIALRDFYQDVFRLPVCGRDSILRLPRSIQEKSVAWSGKCFSELDSELKNQFLQYAITVFEVGTETPDDEIRDLFIRLQSGTALTRQQVRDAWPGGLGPYVERLAGKLDRKPSSDLFGIVDRRGQGAEDDDRDQYTNDRQFAAALLKVFLARERDPHLIVQTRADDLDALYHEFTDWDGKGQTALRFECVLHWTAQILERCRLLNPKRRKFTRAEILTVSMYLQDISRSQDAKVTSGFLDRVAEIFEPWKPSENPSAGRRSSAKYFRHCYDEWREIAPDRDLIRLDPKRLFSPQDRIAAFQRANSSCEVCGQALTIESAEFDHYPIPHRDGGKTVLENCRVVHKRCHPRGRPVDEV